MEASNFHAEIQAKRMNTSESAKGRWSGLFAGAIAAAVVGYIDWTVPALIAMSRNPSVRDHLTGILVGNVLVALIVGVVGGIAGWIGADTERLWGAAWKGALIMMLTQVLFLAGGGKLDQFREISLLKECAVLVNVSALGAIAGSVGAIAGKARRRIETEAAASVQYSLSDFLFLGVLFSILCSSVVFVSR